MDWISITTNCYSLGNAIAKTFLGLNAFVRDVRESRSELYALSSELHALDAVTDLLKDDAAFFPLELATLTPAVLQHCIAVVHQLERYISSLNNQGVSRRNRKIEWIATKNHIANLRLALYGYKSTLGLAVDLVAFATNRDESSEPRPAKDTEDETSVNDAKMREERSMAVGEMGRLTARLQVEFQNHLEVRRYLDALQAFAEGAGMKFDENYQPTSHPAVSSQPASSQVTSSIPDTPDSAIGLNDESSFKISKEHLSIGGPRETSSMPAEERNVSAEQKYESDDRLNDLPTRPPTPPTGNAGRSVSIHSSVAPFDHHRLGTETSGSVYSFVTNISSGGRPVDCSPGRQGRMGKLFGSVRNAFTDTPIESLPPLPGPTNGINGHLSVLAPQPNLVQRGSRRLSRTFKSFPSRKAEDPPGPETSEPDNVFGVSLQKSMQVARSSAKTHHSGSGTSQRTFPLCVYKCSTFIKDQGLDIPDIFGEPGNPERLQALKNIFSLAPSYGEDIDWAWFEVYEAADLILLYLRELPKPLIPEAVAKRWISLSKQAAQPGSHGTRLEQCIDFWEEAMGGVRGSARNLFKLLLNLLGDIADNADKNDMTAERLAGRLVQPLMHTEEKTHTTDYILGLAFLIRKRSEYSLLLLHGGKRKSKAEF